MARRLARDRLCRATRSLTASGLALALGLPAGALGAAAPEPVVLVLKLISETHARPVTGVVIAPDGQVLVPARFVARGDDIVVLDGGTDILRHGRATRPVARSAELGLAVLSAAGLERPAAVLAGDADGARELRFVAYPPAEALAEGAPPISETVRQLTAAGDGPRIDPATPLPNLDGILLDRCGYLAGLVLAEGEPGLEGEQAPRTLLGDDLPEALARLGLQPAMRNCRGGPASTAVAAVEPERSAAGPEMLDPATLQPARPDLALIDPGPRPEPERADEPAPSPAEAAATAAGTTQAPSAGPALPARTEPGPAESRSSHWKMLAGLMVAALLGWLLGRRKPAGHATAPDPAAAADPRSPGHATPSTGAPESGQALIARWSLADGRSEERRIDLPSSGSGLLLGSGPVDLVVDDASIGRLHARLQRRGDILTLTDLGSGRGTWINGVACLEGECFHLPAVADIRLGQVQLRLFEDTGEEPEAAT
jgi:hypothetical protein